MMVSSEMEKCRRPLPLAGAEIPPSLAVKSMSRRRLPVKISSDS